MISKKLSQMLSKQIGDELFASHYYLGISAYFARESLEKWAEFFKAQSEEERGHALRIINFLIDVGIDFTLPAVGEAKAKYPSAEAAVEAALKHEQKVTKSFQTMAQVALQEKDYTGFQFLQWFLGEQVEEEALMQKCLDVLRGVPNPFEAQEFLPEREH
jgi:ferritin